MAGISKFLKLARAAAAAADAKKGEDIVILNVRRLTTVADYFVLVTATSSPQTHAISNAIHEACADLGVQPVHREGGRDASWSVLDFGGLVVHIMSPEQRSLYALEKLWAEAKRV